MSLRTGRVPGRSLAKAVASGAALVAVVALFYRLGTGAFFVLICAAVEIALFEFFDCLSQTGRRTSALLGLACGLGVLASGYSRRPALVLLVLAVAAFGALLLGLRRSRGATPVGDAAWTVLGVAWIGGGGAAAAALLMLPGAGLGFVVAFIGVAAMADIAAYFAGTRFGRHSMAPQISPAKSWEGFAGGFFAAAIGGLVAATAIPQLTLWRGLALGLICGVLGPAGDLVESLFKREMGIKDSGRLLPGHGGLLDRLDAMIFCAPWVFVFVSLVRV